MVSTPRPRRRPGCPASPGVDRAKWAEPSPQSPSALLPPVPLVLDLPLEPAARGTRTAATASARASGYLYTTPDEVDQLVEALDHTRDFFSGGKR